MANIQKRKNKNKTYSYKVQIRLNDGLPPIYKTFPTKEEAKDWARQEEAKRRKGIYFPDQVNKKKTLQNLIERYVELILPEKPKNASNVEQHLKWWSKKLGNYCLNLISVDILDKCRRELLTGITSKGTKRSRATVNRYTASISAVFTYGVKCGWVKENPTFKLVKFKESSGRDRVLIEDECAKLLEECKKSKNPFLYVIVALALGTGARKSEILSLTWNCIDFDQKIIFIKTSKNNRPRALPLPEKIAPLLLKFYNTRNTHISLVFPGKKLFSPICIKKAWYEALKRADIKNLKFHDLRHNFSTMAAKEGASNLELCAATGHITLQMLKRYTHLDVNHTRKFVESVTNKIL